jgi:bifunctional non-homologous end joining protein LigD
MIFYAFDMLYFDGRDLTRMSLDERRHLLEELLAGSGSTIRLSEEFDGEGDAFFKAACEMGLEGIIAKRRDRPYRSGRNGDWLKIKCIQSETFLVVGYEPSTKVPGAIASLLLAARQGAGITYVGSVGTGFSVKQAVDLRRQLDGMKATAPHVTLKRKGAVFVRPELAAEIEFRAWTTDGKLRHPSFKRLRDEADRGDILSLDDPNPLSSG